MESTKKNLCPMSGQLYLESMTYFQGKLLQCSHPDCHGIFKTPTDGKYPEHETVYMKDGLL